MGSSGCRARLGLQSPMLAPLRSMCGAPWDLFGLPAGAGDGRTAGGSATAGRAVLAEGEWRPKSAEPIQYTMRSGNGLTEADERHHLSSVRLHISRVSSWHPSLTKVLSLRSDLEEPVLLGTGGQAFNDELETLRSDRSC